MSSLCYPSIHSPQGGFRIILHCSTALSLSARLEAALLREVAEAYRHLALAYFKGALKIPQFELVSSRARLGRWMEDTRVIEAPLR